MQLKVFTKSSSVHDFSFPHITSSNFKIKNGVAVNLHPPYHGQGRKGFLKDEETQIRFIENPNCERLMVTRNGGLPEDMLVEILSKLPVKSLIRLKCVCKPYCGQKLSLYPDQTLSNLSHHDIDPQIPVLRQIMGPHDGLFCLYGYNQIFLWNPATRETMALPKCRNPMLMRPFDPGAYYCNIGFGLDPMNNDYKLVLIRTLWDDETHLFYECFHVSMYNLSTNSWKDFEVVELTQYSLHKRSDSLYSNGICYWSAIRDNKDHQVILSFHMSDEILREIEGPNIPESMSADLGLYNGSLSLLLIDTV
ncbi:hypothetical protein Pint_28437 [Pistacia integerrima]|uniref:Uncharacterized protein n=1 Tax=Pistacia integerrima TaxID=434235 RepID=A0ACC0YRA7_9ROSI|nr:hypothetical protein Pint_28437 [Pistacia integerrima]